VNIHGTLTFGLPPKRRQSNRSRSFDPVFHLTGEFIDPKTGGVKKTHTKILPGRAFYSSLREKQLIYVSVEYGH
jgi:hypothetical protein